MTYLLIIHLSQVGIDIVVDPGNSVVRQLCLVIPHEVEDHLLPNLDDPVEWDEGKRDTKAVQLVHRAALVDILKSVLLGELLPECLAPVEEASHHWDVLAEDVDERLDRRQFHVGEEGLRLQVGDVLLDGLPHLQVGGLPLVRQQGENRRRRVAFLGLSSDDVELKQLQSRQYLYLHTIT